MPFLEIQASWRKTAGRDIFLMVSTSEKHNGDYSIRTLLRTLAEKGLLRLPLMVFVGRQELVDCLSPYTRDLATDLDDWQKSNNRQEPHPRRQTHPEDQRYITAKELVGDDKRLRDERRHAEQSVGITHYDIQLIENAGGHDLKAMGTEVAIVDLRRIDRTAVDSRLSGEADTAPRAAIVLALPQNDEGQKMLAQVSEIITTPVATGAAAYPGDHQTAIEFLRPVLLPDTA